MGISTFVREAGERIVTNAKAAFGMNPGRDQPQAAPTPSQRPAGTDKSPSEVIADYIRTLKLDIDDLKVRFDAPSATIHVSGVAEDQATKEKVILSCGNIAGVEKVDENITVREASAPVQ